MSVIEVQKLLQEKNVDFDSKGTGSSAWWGILGTLLPFALLLLFWLFLMNQVQGGGSKVMSFGKSRAKRMSPDSPKVTFKDVAGCDEAVEELQEIKEFLENPKKFQALGARIPKGVLLYGPPGTGKTLLARAVAGEAGVPFFSISGSDFVEMFVGVGASRVRDLFEQGKKNAPCIIFIDEIDAVGRHRGAGLGGGHDEREQTLNQLLVEMDGFESNDGVILIAATNRPDVLDPALLRPGRFDRRVVVPRPDVKGREGILAVHTKKIPLGDDVNIHVLARGTSGFSGADLKNLINEAALLAARKRPLTFFLKDYSALVTAVLLALALALAAAFAGVQPLASSTVILATTTSPVDSGLLDVLVPVFERKTGLSVKTIAVGTGQALALVVLFHRECDLGAAGRGHDVAPAADDRFATRPRHRRDEHHFARRVGPHDAIEARFGQLLAVRFELQLGRGLVGEPGLREGQEVVEETVVVEAALVFRVTVADQELRREAVGDRPVGGDRDPFGLVGDLGLRELAGVVVVGVTGRIGVAETGAENRAAGHLVDQRVVGPQSAVALVGIGGDAQRKAVGRGP